MDSITSLSEIISVEREEQETHTHVPEVGDDLCVCGDLVVQLPTHLHNGGLQQRVNRHTHREREREKGRESERCLVYAKS